VRLRSPGGLSYLHSFRPPKLTSGDPLKSLNRARESVSGYLLSRLIVIATKWVYPRELSDLLVATTNSVKSSSFKVG